MFTGPLHTLGQQRSCSLLWHTGQCQLRGLFLTKVASKFLCVSVYKNNSSHLQPMMMPIESILTLSRLSNNRYIVISLAVKFRDSSLRVTIDGYGYVRREI